jgi:hypothetical protein
MWTILAAIAFFGLVIANRQREKKLSKEFETWHKNAKQEAEEWIAKQEKIYAQMENDWRIYHIEIKIAQILKPLKRFSDLHVNINPRD